MLQASVFSQADSTAGTFRKDIAGFPVVYYSPETSFAFGALGLLNFNWKNDSINARSSSITPGLAYTLNKQLLFYTAYNLFLNNDSIRVNGELGYYDYVYFYFGKGNVPGAFEDKREAFEVSFSRIQVNGLKKVGSNTFIGANFAFDHYFNLRLEESSKIRDEQLTGINVGTNFGLGPAFLYDSRNSVFYPRKGSYFEVASIVNLDEVVSDYDYFSLTVDYRSFWSLTKSTVLGANLNYQQNTGNVPFYQLSMIGGGKGLRGIFKGEYRDHFAWQSQMEVRQELFKNFGTTAFVGVGWINKDWSSLQFQNYHVGYGVGFRYQLNKKDHVNIRLDLGFGEGKFWPYFTIGEAF